jgi:hypothetical protein
MKSNQIPLKSLYFPKNGKRPKIQTIGGSSTSPLPSPSTIQQKKFQISSSLLKPVTRLVRIKPHRWHCYSLGNYLKIVDPITRVYSGIGFGTDLGSRIYPVIGLKELTP